MDRLLDGRERQYWLLGQVTPVNAMLHARVRGGLRAPQVRKALDELQRRHTLLGVHIEAAPGGARFLAEGTDTIPVRAEPRTDPDAWLAVYEAEMNLRFDDGPAPLLRAVLLEGEHEADLILACHHAAGDGLSLVDLLGNLVALAAGQTLRALAPENVAAEQLAVSDQAPPGPKVPASERLADLARFWMRLTIAKPARLRRATDAPPGQRRTRLEHHTLVAAEVEALAAACRRERTTVHGALCAALLLAQAEVEGWASPRRVGCRTPIDLRPQLARPVRGGFGVFAFGASTYHRAGASTPFWELARDVRAQVQDAVEGRRILPALQGLDRYVARTAEQAAATAQRSDRLDLTSAVVSNLGRVPELRAGPLRVESVGVSGALPIGNAVMVVCTTYDGILDMDFVHAVPLLDAERARRMADGCVARLRRAAER